MTRTVIQLDRALRAAEKAITRVRIERPEANSGALAYAALKAAIPILDQETAA